MVVSFRDIVFVTLPSFIVLYLLVSYIANVLPEVVYGCITRTTSFTFTPSSAWLTFALGCSSLVYIVITIFTLYNIIWACSLKT